MKNENLKKQINNMSRVEFLEKAEKIIVESIGKLPVQNK
jgi:hypothetical protein